ncbi:NAD-dependent DNA ligase [uncultured Selenomonas sp.]|uniref:NAD-dependent DNA ligase n=1 Tax=uncultured Selenomonas sp. TaxID=159275 RepID=UPI0026748B44|nr:NAD-dependent DNA ligase [uncultured Selenomonas sp.]
MENLAAKIETLRLSAKSIIDIADELAKSLQVEEAKPPSLEDVRHKLILAAQAGFSAEVKALITKYGADRLSEIDASHYAALLKEAESIREAKVDG